MSLNIIEVLSDGNYRLFEDNLKQVLSKVGDCHKIAVISIIGSHSSGKSFFQNCIIDYVKSEDKDNWPNNRTLDPKKGFNIDVLETNRKLIKIFSEPLIVESNGEKTAVILMDTNNVFDKCYLDNCPLINDIIGLFLTTSSTTIYLRQIRLSNYNVNNFEEFVTKSLANNGNNVFQQLLFVVRDWFGQTIDYNNSMDYLKQLSPQTQLDNYFKRIDVSIILESYLCKSNTRIEFNEIRPGIRLLETIKKYIINSDQMSFKTYPNSDQPMNVEDLFQLFRSYISKLNEESVSYSDRQNVSIKDSLEHILFKIEQDHNDWFIKNFETLENGDKLILNETGWNKIHTKMNEKYKNFDSKTVREMKIYVESKVNEIVTQINSKYDSMLSELKSNYSDLIDQCIDKYKSQYILEIRSLSYITLIRLRKVHDVLLPTIIAIYRNKTSTLPKNNLHLIDKSISELKSRLENGLNSFEAIDKYIKQWEDLNKKNHFFESDVLVKKHNDIKQFFLNKAGTPEFNNLFEQIMEKIFEDIKLENQRKFQDKMNLSQQLINTNKNKCIEAFERKKEIDDLKPRPIKTAIMTDISIDKLNNNNNSDCPLKGVSDSEKKLQLGKIDIANRIISNVQQDIKEMDSKNSKYIINHINWQLIDDELECQLKNYDENRIEEMKTYVRNKLSLISTQSKFAQINIIPQIVTDNSDSLLLSLYFSHKTIFGAISDDIIQNVFHISSPNCIAIKEDILIGKDAEKHFDKFNETREYDIKKLLFRKQEEYSEILKDSHPFKMDIIDGILKVKFNNHWLRIETLIALQVLDIKWKAEKQLAKDVKNGVFVVPTSSKIHHRESFRSLSSITELKSVRVLSELTAAAIGYCHLKTPVETCYVLLIAINDMTCDAAVVRLDKKTITYKNYWHRDLNQVNERNKNSLSVDQRIEKSINILFQYLFKNICVGDKITDIKDIVITGTSNQIELIVNQVDKHFERKAICDDSGLFVLTGAEIYGKHMIEDKEEFRFDIKEFAFHNLSLTTMHKNHPSPSMTILKCRQSLPYHKVFECDNPKAKCLPLDVNIYQEKDIVKKYRINKFNQTYLDNTNKNIWRHSIQIEINDLGEIKFKSFMLADTGYHGINDFDEISFAISSEDIESEKQFISSLKRRNEPEVPKIVLSIDDKTTELKKYCQQIRHKLQNNNDMTRLKRKRIEGQLNCIEKFFNSSEIQEMKVLDVIEGQLKELDNLIE